MEFLVDSVEEDGKVYCVRGACTQGIIEVGATFLQACKKIRRFFNNEYELIGTENHRAIVLKVARIIAYRHILDSLPQGMSCAVYLVEDRGDCIATASLVRTGCRGSTPGWGQRPHTPSKSHCPKLCGNSYISENDTLASE